MNWYLVSYSREKDKPPYYMNFSSEDMDNAQREVLKRIAEESKTSSDAKIKELPDGEWKTLQQPE